MPNIDIVLYISRKVYSISPNSIPRRIFHLPHVQFSKYNRKGIVILKEKKRWHILEAVTQTKVDHLTTESNS